MFTKYQLKHKGGKALKNSDDTGLDDRLVKKFYKEFRRDPKNKKQIEMIEKLKSKENIEDDEDFVLSLIEEGEIFNLQDTRVLVDFQIDIDSELKQGYSKAVKEAKDDYVIMKRNIEQGNYLHPGLEKPLVVEESDSETGSEKDSDEENEEKDEK